MKNKAHPPSITDEGTCVFGAGVLLKHLQALEAEIEGVQAGEADIEFIHRARVASRRLRAALPLFQGCIPQKKGKGWLKNIRGVTRALGEARDVDVQLARLEEFAQSLTTEREKAGIQRLALRLRQKRAALQPHVTQAMEEFKESSVLEEMGAFLQPVSAREDSVYVYTPALYTHSFQSITARLDAFLAYEPVISQPEMVTELHEMRIAAKQMRYTLENFTSLYANGLKPYIQAVRKAQDILGDIHDCDVWVAFLPQFLEDERQRVQDYYGHTRVYRRFVPGIEAFQTDCQTARQDLFHKFQSTWEKWQRAELWIDLRRTIQVHFPQVDQLYPPAAPAPAATDPANLD